MPKGLKRALSALLIAVFLYSLIGFLILPGVALRIANQQLAQYATVPARLQLCRAFARRHFRPNVLPVVPPAITPCAVPAVAIQPLYAGHQAVSRRWPKTASKST